MNSTLYLGTNPESLAGRLAALLDEENARPGLDSFVPVTLILPNRYLAKWLRLWLARRLGVVANLHFGYLLETAMYKLLANLDPRPQPPLLLDADRFRLMVLAALLEDQANDAELAPLQDYLRRGNGTRRELYRRAWQLADRLSRLLRDYEYHRQEQLIQPWLAGSDRLQPVSGDRMNAVTTNDKLERSQRALYRRIMRDEDGLRARLGKKLEQEFRTLPQYALELMALLDQGNARGADAPHSPTPERMVHVFGLTQISSLHVRVLHWLGQHYDLRLYHINPLVGKLRSSADLRETMRDVAQQFRPVEREPGRRSDRSTIDELLAAWGVAGAESLLVMSGFLQEPRVFAVERVPDPVRAEPTTVLHRLQDDLLHRPVETKPLPQDCSLQVVSCPGLYREVETVYQSILHNLQETPDLRQTDIAVLTVDMPRYRPVLQAVFERRPRHLAYNLADFSAAGLSVFGHALLGLLDLALESFTRSRVLEVLLNPCFLTRLGVDREQALVWLGWAEELGIYHGWDRRDRRERGYPDSALYSWRLGLQRLRLGRLMDVTDEIGLQPASCFQRVIPFADLTSGDKEQLDAFCRAIEGLLPRLRELRDRMTTGQRWAFELRRLVEDFLAVPDDRADEESAVRDRLLQSLAGLELLDHLGERGASAPRDLPLALVREFVEDALEQVEGTKGEYLTGGVTISALQPLRPVPFRIIYLLGLGEGDFPGSDQLATLDLRSRQRLPGDIRQGESNRFLFLEALLAARDKIYLLYPGRDMQKDQPLYPCSPINQLRRYLEQRVLESNRFDPVEVPLEPGDPKYVNQRFSQLSHTDVLVTYAEPDRLRALEEARQREGLRLDERREKELHDRLEQARRKFQLPATAPAEVEQSVTIRLRDLAGFLRCPAEAALKRHLRLYDDEEIEPADDEPFYTEMPRNYRLLARALEQFVQRGVQDVDEALGQWRSDLARLHQEWQLRGRAPQGPFADVDRARFERLLERQILGSDGLAAFLRERRSAEFCGPVLLGESPTPIGARCRFPALKLTLGGPGLPAEVRLIGSLPFAWRDPAALHLLVLTTRNRKKVPNSELSVPMLEPLLFWLALLAGTEPGPDGGSRDWLGERELHLCIAYEEGLVRFQYLPADVSPEAAREYLVERVREFLDRTAFDLVPFDLVVAKSDLTQPYRFRDDAEHLAHLRQNGNGAAALPDAELLARARRKYRRAFKSAVKEDEEKEMPSYHAMDLLQIARPSVPKDVFDQLRRRFWLLDRGPARRR